MSDAVSPETEAATHDTEGGDSVRSGSPGLAQYVEVVQRT